MRRSSDTRLLPAICLTVLVFASCAAEPPPPGLATTADAPPSAAATAPASVTTSPAGSAAASSAAPFIHPLPPDLIGRSPRVHLAEPRSPRGIAEVGTEYAFSLQHCGIGSPIDFDGSLWQPIGASDEHGGPISDVHVGELINQTAGTLLLTDASRAEFRTASGLVLYLERLPGPARYALCA